jgi:xylulokinase
LSPSCAEDRAVTFFLGVDLGTQSLKALLLDPHKGVLASVAEPLSVLPGLPPGHVEQDPAAWLAALQRCAEKLKRYGADAWARVKAIGVSGQQHGLVPLDEHGAVIRPCKLWNDVSSAPQCQAIVRELGGRERLFALTGGGLPPGFTAGKIRWLREVEPAHFARLRLVLLPHDWLNLWLTGNATMEWGDASGTGLFDPRARRFVPEVLERVAPGLAGMLPPLLLPGEPAGTLGVTASQALGLPEGTIVSTGSGDNMMAALGAGAVRPGVAVVSLGTSGTVFAFSERPVTDPGGEVAAFCDATGHWLPLGCTMNATVASEVTRKAVGVVLQDLDAVAASAPPGCDGVLCLPFFTGERSPALPHARGAFLGLTPANCTPAHLLRSALEGATFGLARLADRLAALGVDMREVRLTGGGSQSPLWRRVLASALARPLTTGLHADAAALGAAVHACWTYRKRRQPKLTAAEAVRDLDLERNLQMVDPDPDWQRVYAERRAAWERALPAEPIRRGSE